MTSWFGILEHLSNLTMRSDLVIDKIGIAMTNTECKWIRECECTERFGDDLMSDKTT